MFDEGLHPKLNIQLDYKPSAYDFDEDLHGPSRRTVATRRITRRALARLQPWAEEDALTGAVAGTAVDDDETFPSAEEEAEAFFQQEQYWEDISYDPFTSPVADTEEEGTDDAAGFWDTVPCDAAQPTSMDVDSDDDAADVQHPLADELFGADPEVEARLSRRQATLHKQGSRFWGALEDFQLPRGH